jgi:hypothetical protein
MEVLIPVKRRSSREQDPRWFTDSLQTLISLYKHSFCSILGEGQLGLSYEENVLETFRLLHRQPSSQVASAEATDRDTCPVSPTMDAATRERAAKKCPRIWSCTDQPLAAPISAITQTIMFSIQNTS